MTTPMPTDLTRVATPAGGRRTPAEHVRRRGGADIGRLLPFTVVLALLVLLTSLCGLATAWPYAAETANWRLQAQGQDLGNIAAVGVLVAGALAARRGSLGGRLAWLGALLYLAYAFAIYAFTLHFGRFFLLYVAILGLSVYGSILGAAGTRTPPTASRAGGWLLTAIAVLFGVLWLGSIVPATLAGTVPGELADAGLVANPVHVLDLALVLPGMAAAAALARRGRRPGLLLQGPWLVFSALMGASIVAALVLGGGAPGPLVAVGAITVASAVLGVRELGRVAAGRQPERRDPATGRA